MDMVIIRVTYLHAIITQSIIIILNKVLFLRSIQNNKMKYFILPLFIPAMILFLCFMQIQFLTHIIFLLHEEF